MGDGKGGRGEGGRGVVGRGCVVLVYEHAVRVDTGRLRGEVGNGGGGEGGRYEI